MYPSLGKTKEVLPQSKDSYLIDLLNDFEIEAAEAYKAAYDFGEKELAPLNAQMERDNSFPAHLWTKMGAHDFLAARIHPDFGGAGMSFLCHAMITQGLSYHSGSVALSQLAHSDLCTGRVAKWGNAEQKREYLPGLAKGTLVGALAMSEPDAGSDVIGSMKTKAVKCTGGWKINGEKTWITNGGNADVLVLYAKTNDKKVTAFLVEPKKLSGFKAESKWDKHGMRGSETWTLAFDDCFVPDHAVLGNVDKGAHILMDGLNTERVVLASAAIGLAQSSLDYSVYHISNRKQFQKPLASFQQNAFDVANAQSKIWTVQNSIVLYAHQYDRNAEKLTNVKAASVFLEAGEVARDITQKCNELCGGMGYTKDLPVGQKKLDADLYLIGGGTMNVRREVIARAKLPAYADYSKWEQEMLKLSAAQPT